MQHDQDDFLLGHGGLLVLVELLAAALVLAVTVQLPLGRVATVSVH